MNQRQHDPVTAAALASGAMYISADSRRHLDEQLHGFDRHADAELRAFDAQMLEVLVLFL